LQRGGLNFLLRRRRLKIEQRLDVAAHFFLLKGSAQPGSAGEMQNPASGPILS
jgi:hypothetical protein